MTTGQYAGNTNITINGKTDALPNNCVKDRLTGLMWARYVNAANIGVAADGRLFWQGWTLTNENVSFAAAGKTITAVAGNPFNVTALAIGRVFTVAGTANNDGTYTVAGIAGNVITTVEALVNEGPVATDFATVGDLIWDVVQQANANALGGHTDWRVPNINELFTILDHSTFNPIVDGAVFPATPTWYHWSATTYSSNVAYAFYIQFQNGDTTYQIKTNIQCHVRLVRG